MHQNECNLVTFLEYHAVSLNMIPACKNDCSPSCLQQWLHSILTNEQCNSDTWIFPFLVHSPIRCTQAWPGRIGGHWWSRCHSTSTCQRSHGTISSVSVINCEWVRLREVFVWNYIIWQNFEIIKVTLCILFLWCTRSKYWFDKITYSCMYEIKYFKICT